MAGTLRGLSYLAASMLFILSLRGLSTQETARRGNAFGTLGMALAVLITAVALLLPGSPAAQSGHELSAVGLLAGALGVGCVIGAFLASRVAMTSMPELVAMLHSFVGAAAVLVGIATYLQPGAEIAAARSVHLVEIFVGVLVGAVTFSGSIVAFGKLRGVIGSKPLLLPGRHVLNLLLLAGCVVLGALFLRAPAALSETGSLWDGGLAPLLAMTAIALALGVHLVMAIGGGDMPVVVSLLNSYSGWAAAAAGFMLSNDLLIITGALVGSSGAILSYIMCKAMNRSIFNVILGGFGAEAGKPAAGGAAAP